MGDIDLRTHLEMLMIRGFLHFDLKHFMDKVYLPIVLPLMDLVCIPFFAGRCLSMLTVNYTYRTLLVRYSSHMYIICRCLVYLARAAINYLVTLHNEIRDSRYLVGTQLENRSR